jgi:hypothetical protein
MACGCGKRTPREPWQPRSRRAQAEPQGSGEGRRIVTPAERAHEAEAAARPRRAQQPSA